MKRITALSLAFLICLCAFSACDDALGIDSTEESAFSPEVDTTDRAEGSSGMGSEDTGSEAPGAGHALNGKKIIFIGNSHSYYGKALLDKGVTEHTQAARSNDEGYFYQLCRSNGAAVSVTNWSFGNHGFTDLFKMCEADRGCNGVDHLGYLEDRSFDYVVMQYETGSDEGFLENCRMVMDVFKAANESVKFVFHVQRRAHELNCLWLSELKVLEDMGVTVVDWGGLVDGLISGEITVPGAEQTYDQNSFIVCKSADDGYHPNMLTGYITALSIYCAITGESAVGQEYSFCGDVRLNKEFNVMNFICKYYTYDGATTNFDAILDSETDMRGIQQLIDAYLAEGSYRNY
ncbi:MAG: hypothetical protein IKC26_11430 [Clostridia bacterium]|nr:hypothetical protein [Clostridia bacterium]MBR2908638.1 hypothetical protein [Clostridia bacterium]